MSAEIIQLDAYRLRADDSIDENLCDVTTAMDVAIRDLREILKSWGSEGARARAIECERMLSRVYLPHMETRYEDAAARQADLAQLVQIAATYLTRERFLTELTLDPPDATSDEAGVPLLDEDYLILSTIHSAKGQEWHSVFVLNTVDGCIPSDLGTGTTPEIEEERRLLYVAMTRARDQLHIMVPQRFFTHGQRGLGDRHVYAQRTRFISNNLTKHFQGRYWPTAKGAQSAARSIRTPVDVKAKMRGMWS